MAPTSIILGRGHAFRVMEGASPVPPTPWFRTFGLFPFNNNVAKNGATNEVFADLMDLLSVNIERLTLGAEAPLVDLIDLDKQLVKIRETVTHNASTETSEIFVDLWEVLSGNKMTPKRIDENRSILQAFDSTRDSALAYVTSAQRGLQTARKQMGELRQRVAMPESGGETTPMTILNSLRDGIDGLQEMKTQLVRRRGRAVAQVE
jgi:hypothetical protein